LKQGLPAGAVNLLQQILGLLIPTQDAEIFFQGWEGKIWNLI
jgi:hypothetical protein